MNNLTRVSIVTPSFNQADYLENTILSILEQDYPNLEHIIIDGGSRDGSVEIIKKYKKYLSYWHSCPDNGQVEAINYGFQQATGELFTFINSDDFLLKGAVSHIVELYHQYPQAVGWVGGAHAIARDGFILHTRLPQKLSYVDLANWADNWIFQPACFFTAKIAKLVGLFNPVYHNAFDFDFWLKIARLGEIVPTTRIIAAATVHPDAKTQRFRARMFSEVKKIQLDLGFDDYAQITQGYFEQANKQTSTGTLAKLLFMSHSSNRSSTNRFVRLPQLPEGLELGKGS